jgi:glycyl-tRNA synthetase beta subunit
LALALGSVVVVAQVSPEQAETTLKAKQQQRTIQATQPISHEELDEAWEEIHRLRGDVKELQDQVAVLRRNTRSQSR